MLWNMPNILLALGAFKLSWVEIFVKQMIRRLVWLRSLNKDLFYYIEILRQDKNALDIVYIRYLYLGLIKLGDPPIY